MLEALYLLVVITTAAPFNVEIYELPTQRLCEDARMVRQLVDQPNQFQYSCEMQADDPGVDPRLAVRLDD